MENRNDDSRRLQGTDSGEGESGDRHYTATSCEDLSALAEAIRAAARKQGMGLRRLHAASGVAHTTILRIAKGERPRKGTLLQLADALGEDPERWLALAGYSPKKSGGASFRIVTDPPPASILRRIAEEADLEKRVLRAWEYVASCPVLKFEARGTSHEERLGIVRTWEELTGYSLLPREDSSPGGGASPGETE